MIRTVLAVLAIIFLPCHPVLADDEKPSVEDQISAAALAGRLPLKFDGIEFSGPAWDRLVAEGSAAQFFLIGEEHGIAENPKLAGQLFAELAGHGYSKLAIEISPTMASLLDDAAAAGGLDGLRALFGEPGGEPAFFGMAEEAEMLATVRASVPTGEPAFWGTDYEVAGDRQLLRLLAEADKPPAAAAALEVLASASTKSWEEYAKTGSIQYIFSFAGNLELVRAVSEAWPEPDPRSAVILNTLEKTLEVNNLWSSGKAWESNRSRAALQRENFLRHWHAAKQAGEKPRVMAKYGASHVVRGLSQTAVFDLGTLVPELAALQGGHAVSMMVVPGAGSSVATLEPTTFGYIPKPAEGSYLKGLAPLTGAAFDQEFTLIDLRAIRPVIGMKRRELHDELFRVVHGFDLLLVMSGSNPSTELDHD